MDTKIIFSKMNSYLQTAAKELSDWLFDKLSKISDNWWNDCVISKLSTNQRDVALSNNFTSLDNFDLSTLLRIADKSWYEIKSAVYLSAKERDYIKDMIHVSNNWVYNCSIFPGKDVILSDLNTIYNFFEKITNTENVLQDVSSFIHYIEDENYSEYEIVNEKINIINSNNKEKEIVANTIVYPVGMPDKRGYVISIDSVGNSKKYTVFLDGKMEFFLEGQIAAVSESDEYNWVDINTFRSLLTAYQINKPSVQNLYSLNSARIDFVPYQFRPALKMIHADEPRILIADSVGVGKTIEAGLIIKELDARKSLESIMIICPKPLVAEHKWECEMKRFDEDFIEVDGTALRQAISDTHRDDLWPVRYNKIIVPYSILDSRTYNGDEKGLNHNFGLKDLDPAPHFDLVIIDEAHHIRNGSMEKEKAFEYKCCKYFCDHADAVVMLTATPLQTSDNDLFVLLNMLRPDIIIDKETFNLMSRPNAYISKCSKLARSADINWREQVLELLENITKTQWGENVTINNPAYSEVMEMLKNKDVSREERVKVISLIESLHSFNDMLNRTRRKDIQDFCVRRSYTIESEFTEYQKKIHDLLLVFEKEALSSLHNERCVPFMMSSLRRQAASCIFGLAPHIKDILNRRFVQMYDDPNIDITLEELSFQSADYFERLAHNIISLAENLPEEDPKFDRMLEAIEKKQEMENNKIIIFSTYKHTLNYIKNKLQKNGYRVAKIDGDVKDADRLQLRKQFELPKSEENALDILLFTEVGSEGLDYQFCDMMINYDLPWNPMVIEQRIGRIDRRGQKSESVSIYNLITKDTIDADIYYRCLLRIGIFENSIGECDQIIGDIGKQIKDIAVDSNLTDIERKIKLEQMADNEIRRIQEINSLEDQEKELFAFDLSNFAISQEISRAESPWLSPKNIQNMIETYLNDLLGAGKYIIGDSDIKNIRLNANNRAKLKESFNSMQGVRNTVRKNWEGFLKGTKPTHLITFDAESSDIDSSAFFITPMHPLAKQAAKHFMSDKNAYICLRYSSDTFEKGKYAFIVYAWNYLGQNEHNRLVTVCENDKLCNELPDILQYVQGTVKSTVSEDSWSVLEEKVIDDLKSERIKHIENAKSDAIYKTESITNNYRNRKRLLEMQISNDSNDSIKRMHISELETAKELYESKLVEIKNKANQADIHMSIIAKGIIEII